MKSVFQAFFIIISLFITITIKAQVINCNPDPNGEPWWVGGTPKPESTTPC